MSDRDSGDAAIQVVDSSALALLHSAEIDTQIVTAKKFPRSIKKCLDDAASLATNSVPIAEACMYAVPRGNKIIEGPSIRLAEIMASAWGNLRFGARTIAVEAEFVVAQGVCHDLEKNTCVTKEVRRRILDKNGKRFNEDMIGVTANAAQSIAMRNAILAVIPGAYTDQIYEQARMVAIGKADTLVARRTACMQSLTKMGAMPDRIFHVIEVKGEEDIDLEKLAVLRAIYIAIRNGEQNVDDAFPPVPVEQGDAPPPPGGTTTEPPAKRKTKSERAADAINKGKPAAEPTAPTAPAAAEPTPAPAADAPEAPEAKEGDPPPAPEEVRLPTEAEIPLACRARSRSDTKVVYSGVELVVPAGTVYDRTRVAVVKPAWAKNLDKPPDNVAGVPV